MRRICETLGLNRSTYYRKVKELKMCKPVVDEKLVEEIQQVIKDARFPGYGYRRVWAVLRYDRKILVNKKKVQRIMKLNGWQAKPLTRPKRCAGEPYDRKRSVVDSKKKIAIAYPNLRWCTDLTKVYTYQDGWVNLIPVLDCFNSECIGWRLSIRGRALEAREALQEAVLNRFKHVQAVPKDLRLRTDNGSIFLAKEYYSELLRLGIEPEYTPYCCPSANGIAERFMKTIKEECIWQYCFKNVQEAEEVIGKWIEFYNNQRRHSRLNYMTPLQYRENFESLRKLVG